MCQLWRKLRNLQPVLLKLNKQYTNMQEKIQQARIELEQAHANLNSNLFDEHAIKQVKYCTDHLTDLNQREESILMQKSKETWLKLGDGNNSFFHASVKEKNKHKGLYTLTSLTGGLLSTQEEIEHEILDFYSALVGTKTAELRSIDLPAIRNGNTLSVVSASRLIRPVEEAEILAALRSIGDSKAPGLDGFNAFFFKTSWQVVKNDVREAIFEFFDTSNLYLAVNCSLITLIPKSPEANTIKDMRPISCCTTIYKIISKILTTRLAEVINYVVHENQSAFVPGRIIHDNIMMAQELIRGYNRKHISPRCMVQMDVQKAYDTIEWSALRYIMIELGFPHIFVN